MRVLVSRNGGGHPGNARPGLVYQAAAYTSSTRGAPPMIRKLTAFALLLMLAAPLAAQAPAGLQMRLDKSTSASDPDDVPDVTITTVGNGFQVNTGPAAVVWNPANTATGVYTVKGNF